MSVKGVGGRKGLKDQMKAFDSLMGIMRGDKMEPVKIRAKRKLRTKPNDMKEKKLERDILMSLSLVNGIAFGKTECDAMYNGRWNFNGFSDLTVFDLIAKKLYFIELKVGKGRLRASQVRFRGYCEMVGIDYIVAYDKKTVMELFNEKTRRRV